MIGKIMSRPVNKMFKTRKYRNLCEGVFERLDTLAPFGKVPILRESEIIREAISAINIGLLPRYLEEDVTALGSLARNSYLHENGFYKLTIMDKPSARFRIRLHFWPYTPSPSNVENIHNHRFNYYSCILNGLLVNKVWKIAPDGNKFHHYRYTPRIENQNYVLDYCGDHSLKVDQEREHQRGDLYAMSATELHTANVARDNNVVTLFIEERTNLRAHADVFSHRYSLGPVAIRSPSLMLNQYLETLRTAISLLNVESADTF